MPDAPVDTVREAPPTWRDTGGPPPGWPWSLRPASGPDHRGALEIYHGHDLLDVMVELDITLETAVARAILRGGQRSDGTRRAAIAWGRLPADGGGVEIGFARSRLSRRVHPASAVWLTAWCWVAVADGAFRRVVVTHRGRSQRLVLRRRGPARRGQPW